MKAYLIADLLAQMEKEYLAQGFKDHAEAIHQALSIIRRASHDDDDPISEPARGHLFPLMKRAKMSLNDLKFYLRSQYGISSTKAIPWRLYEDICQWLIAEGDNQEKKRLQKPGHRRLRPRQSNVTHSRLGPLVPHHPI